MKFSDIVELGILAMCFFIYRKQRQIYECLKCDEQPEPKQANTIDIELDAVDKKQG